MSTLSESIVTLLTEAPAPLGPSEIAERVGTTPGTVDQALRLLVAEGAVEKPRHGRYTVPAEPSEPDEEEDVIGVGRGPALRWPGQASGGVAKDVPSPAEVHRVLRFMAAYLPALYVDVREDGTEIARSVLMPVGTGEPIATVRAEGGRTPALSPLG